MERLLLLWDELDELVGYGRHLAVGLRHAVTRRRASSAPSAPPATLAAAAETGLHRTLNPLN